MCPLSCLISSLVTEAFYVFCGSRWRDTYASVLNISLLSCSWVLAILFAQTLSSSLPWIHHPEELCVATSDTANCHNRYLINMLILALITTPLALMDAKEQWYIQNSLTVIRVVRVVLMCVTPLLAVTSQEMMQSFPGSFTGSHSDAILSPPLWIGTSSGLSQLLSAAVFSLFMNGSIPIVVDCLSDRKNFQRTLYATFFICLGLYLCLALIIATKFGDRTMNPCNLNWAGYRWPTTSLPTDELCLKNSLCDLSAKVVEFLVVFCPALDVASAYPFIGIILGNTLTEIFLGPPPTAAATALASTGTSPSPGTEEQQYISALTHYRLVNKLLRFVMNGLPMLLAVTLTDFSRVIQLTGSVSVLLCTVFPPLLSMKCNNYLEESDPCFITEAESLDWVDPATACTGSGGASTALDLKTKRYGAIGQDDLMERDWVACGFMVRPKEDAIEIRAFQMVMLVVGAVLAAMILYTSM
jgi:hypothetical protein